MSMEKLLFFLIELFVLLDLKYHWFFVCSSGGVDFVSASCTSALDQFSRYLLPPLEISDPIFSSRSDFFQSRFSFPLAHWSAWQGIPFPAQRLAAWPGFILRVSEQGSCLKIFPAP
jgi:hypothetical protein